MFSVLSKQTPAFKRLEMVKQKLSYKYVFIEMYLKKPEYLQVKFSALTT